MSGKARGGAGLQERMRLARDMAIRAGRETLRWFRRPGLAIERKADASPVTEADRQAERLLREAISRHFPDDGVLGEELGSVEGQSGFRWIIDPIDGTKSFICGVPLFATLVGLEYQGQAVGGVIHLPALRETVYAARGQGAWYESGEGEPRPARVGKCADLAESLFVTSQVDTFRKRGAGRVFEALEERAAITRTWGDAYGYLLVATGRAAVMVDAALGPWDAAAVLPILEEAGGRFTDWTGKATFAGGDGIGSNGAVHDEVLAICQRWASDGTV